MCLVTQLCPTFCNPMDCSLPGSSVHEDSPCKNTGVGSHALLQGLFPIQGLNLGLPHSLLSVLSGKPSWQINGETVETVSDFIFLGPKITTDGDCSHEIKRCLLLGRKVVTNLDSMFQSRDITLSTKVHLVKAMVFPVVMYGCESWTWRRLSTEELMLLNCGVGEDSWESLGLQGDPSSPLWRRSALGFLWKEWC